VETADAIVRCILQADGLGMGVAVAALSALGGIPFEAIGLFVGAGLLSPGLGALAGTGRQAPLVDRTARHCAGGRRRPRLETWKGETCTRR
jgi:hypothetical protein